MCTRPKSYFYVKNCDKYGKTMENNDLEGTENVQIHLRVDTKLRDKLVELAKPAQRSLNKQIIYMLDHNRWISKRHDHGHRQDRLNTDLNSALDSMVARDFTR